MKRILIALLFVLPISAFAKGSSHVLPAGAELAYAAKPCFIQITTETTVNANAIIAFTNTRADDEVIVYVGNKYFAVKTGADPARSNYIKRISDEIKNTCK